MNSTDTRDTEDFVESPESSAPLHSMLTKHWRTIVGTGVAAGLISFGVTFLIPPTYTARTSFISPQPQSTAASAMASIGALASLAGGSSAIKNQADQFIALMQSATISDNIINRFGLMDIYEAKFRSLARKQLAENVRITSGKKDGLIYVEVDDHDAQRAADMANRYVTELRLMTSSLALTEAQQRRMFFEGQLKQTRDRLTAAQQALQDSGFSRGDLKSEPKAAAEAYARLKAEQTTTEIRLKALRSTLADNAPEVRRAQATLAGLEVEISKLENAGGGQAKDSGSYVSKYRDYKYEEALFEIFARQFEMAKSDESREGALVQVIDTAMPPDRRTKPRRTITALGGMIAGLIAAAAWAVLFERRRPSGRALT